MRAVLLAVAALAVLGALPAVYDVAHAQDDPTILLTIARRAQHQIEGHLAPDAPAETREALGRGAAHVDLLERALEDGDTGAAKSHFLGAMKIFKQISSGLGGTEAAEIEPARNKDPSGLLQRIQSYVNTLKTVSRNHDAGIDFAHLDEMIGRASAAVEEGRAQEAAETIKSIKSAIVEINHRMRDVISEQAPERAKSYAQKYIARVDSLIADALARGIPGEAVRSLEESREVLSSTDDRLTIISEIRKIRLVVVQFGLAYDVDPVTRMLMISSTLSEISGLGVVGEEDLAEIRGMLEDAADRIRAGEADEAVAVIEGIEGMLRELLPPGDPA